MKTIIINAVSTTMKESSAWNVFRMRIWDVLLKTA